MSASLDLAVNCGATTRSLVKAALLGWLSYRIKFSGSVSVHSWGVVSISAAAAAIFLSFGLGMK